MFVDNGSSEMHSSDRYSSSATRTIIVARLHAIVLSSALPQLDSIASREYGKAKTS